MPPLKLNESVLKKSLVALVGVELLLAIAYLVTSLHWGQSPPALDFNGLRSLPSWLQAAQLFLIGAIGLGLFLGRQKLRHGLSGPLLLAITALCCFGALDEVLKIHLQLKQFNWKGMYLALIIAIPILGWADLMGLWRSQRRVVLWVAAGMGIFLLGGFGAEMLKDGLIAVVSQDHAAITSFTLERLRITVEEFAELLGESLILYGIGQFLVKLNR